MNVFISGTQFVNTDKRWELPETVQESLDNLMSEGAAILIGDCMGVDLRVQEYLKDHKYQNVKIYVSGSKSSTRNNVGKWEEVHFRTNYQTMYAFRIEKDFRMAEDADFGIALWDGESKGTFTNMVYLASQGKSCRVFLIKESRWVNIENIEDLEAFVGEESVIGRKEIRRVMTDCGFSDEMIEYSVSNNTVSPRQLADIICGAPISKDRKRDLFSVLFNKRNIKWEIFHSALNNKKLEKSTKVIKHDIRAIADNREKNTIWTYIWDLYTETNKAKAYDVNPLETLYMQDFLFAEWYDLDDLRLKSSFCGPFLYPEAAVAYIKNEWKYYEPDEIDEVLENEYYRMEVWDTDDTDRKQERYTYYYYKGEMCWFEKLEPERQKTGNVYYLVKDSRFAGGKLDLNIATPYKSGDVVLIDCRPFGPPFYAMILEGRAQFDCCFPNIIFKVPGTEKWRITALKHKNFYESEDGYRPMLSPLYRIRSVTREEVSEDKKEYAEKLFELSKLFYGNEEVAASLWNKWHESGCEDMSDGEVECLFGLRGHM